MDTLKLFNYWRSSASYRVRIALNLKQLRYQYIPVNLLAGEQQAEDYRQRHPQALVPLLVDGLRQVRQSLAIIEYLEECFESRGVHLLPMVPRERQRVRAIALSIAADLSPLQNLRVQRYLETELGASAEQKAAWTQHWIRLGLDAVEAQLANNPSTGEYCEGDTPTLADCVLIPQVYASRRFGVDLTPYPTIQRIYDTAMATDAFAAARPEVQPDAPPTA